MSNFGTHFVVGGLASTVTYALRKLSRNEPLTLAELGGYFLIGGIFGYLPDAIDVPNSPNHRSLAHSLTAIGGISGMADALRRNPYIRNEEKDIIYSLMASYLSHLLLDAQTPKGLPFFTK